MLNLITKRLLGSKAKSVASKKPKPLQMSIDYSYQLTPAATTTPVATPKPTINLPTIEDIFNEVKLHPHFAQGEILKVSLPRGTLLAGFSKPWKLRDYVMVYPDEVRYTKKWDELCALAAQSESKSGVLQLNAPAECIQVSQGGLVRFLVQAEKLRVRHWAVVAD